MLHHRARFIRALAFASSLVALTGCPSPTNGDAATDAVDSAMEAATDAPTDTPRDTGADVLPMTHVGDPCTTAAQCGTGFDCLTGFVDGNLCSRTCRNNASQIVEQQTCGVGNTCLSNVEGDDMYSYCERACDPTMTPTGCRPGFICTGWWANHDGTPDRTGCWTFCSHDSDCPSGLHCNTYRGSCGADPVDLSLRVDGTPCNPMNTVGMPAQSTECRGFCLQAGDLPTQGLCASQLDLAVNTACPDPSENILLNSTDGDNWGLCIHRSCTDDCDCMAPLACVTLTTGSGPVRVCDYPAADGGVANQCGADAGTDAASGDASGDSEVDATVDATAGDAAD